MLRHLGRQAHVEASGQHSHGGGGGHRLPSYPGAPASPEGKPKGSGVPGERHWLQLIQVDVVPPILPRPRADRVSQHEQIVADPRPAASLRPGRTRAGRGQCGDDRIRRSERAGSTRSGIDHIGPPAPTTTRCTPRATAPGRGVAAGALRNRCVASEPRFPRSRVRRKVEGGAPCDSPRAGAQGGVQHLPSIPANASASGPGPSIG